MRGENMWTRQGIVGLAVLWGIACGPGGGGGKDVPDNGQSDAAGDTFQDNGGPDLLKEEVESAECSPKLNPSCKETECKLPDGTVGRCQKDEAVGCVCKPQGTPQDPCSEELNPECKPIKCALAPNVDGLCGLDEVTGQCTCGGGTPPPQGPCSEELNPECKDVECKLPDGTVGRCQKDEAVGCVCKPQGTPQDPCSKELNPECKPIKCALAPNVDGLCGLDEVTGQCTCGGGTPPDPCDVSLNPTCKPVGCTNDKGVKGNCGIETASGNCVCIVPQSKCATDGDCVGQEWLVDCLGHWDCVGGQCQATCGDPCGNNMCEVDQGESSDTCPTDCEGVCNTNDDCASTDFCMKTEGNCNGTGSCATRPEFCSEVYLPVCGCDGKNYQNDCLANSAGVNVQHQGYCQGGSDQ